MMSRKYLIPIALMLMLVLAACSPQQTAETGAAAAAGSSMDAMPEEQGDPMAENSGDSMDDMGESAMDEETMGDEAMDDDTMDDDAMDDSHDEMAEMDETEAGAGDDMAGEDESMADTSAEMMDLPAWQTLPLTNVATGESFTLADFQGKTVFVEPMATWCSNCRMQQGQVIQAKTQLSDDVVFVGLSLETTLANEDLARYAQGNGFDWTYAVMSEELLAGLAAEFGRTITSAPSTPHFIIRPDGSFTELSTGIHSAAEIIAQIQKAQS